MLTLDPVTSGPLPAADPSLELEPWRDADGLVCARVFRSGPGFLIHWGATSLFFFDPTHRTVRAWTLASSSADATADTFARRVQPLLLQASGYLVLHASGASAAGRVIAFCGLSGAGKSTLARELRRHGCQQWADDAVVIDTGTSPARVLALPFVHPDDDTRLTAAPGRSAPLGAIAVLARRKGAPAAGQIERIADASALATVLAHAHVFDPDAAVSLVDQYATMLDAVPVFRVVFDHAPSGPATLAEAVAAWMRTVEAAS